MKKIIGTLSLVVVLGLSITGCGQTSSPSTSSQVIWSKTSTQTTAQDWKTITADQKKSLVQKAITDWKNEGTTVSQDDTYYINGIDTYFSQSGNESKNVAQAMTAVYIISLSGK
ncbi:MAG: hypothetical protein JWN30_979 [Bacilli bacterium]|nr:hypothetical protein [Bacilli bacterium]